MIETATLAHAIPSAAVYFPLDGPIDKGTLGALHKVLGRLSDADLDASRLESHWQALERRWTGRLRWDSVVERKPLSRAEGRQGYLERAASHLTPQNLAARLGHFSPVVENVQYTIDYFNPANELGMPYRDAGEAVLVLLMQSTESAINSPRFVRDHMPDSFFDILRDLVAVLRPKGVFGCYSLMSTLTAFLAGRAAPRHSPWDFLFQLHLLRDPPIPVTSDTRIPGTLVGMLPGKETGLHRVEDYGDRRVLIQINPGFDAMIRWQSFAVAKALNMHCIQELCEGELS